VSLHSPRSTSLLGRSGRETPFRQAHAYKRCAKPSLSPEEYNKHNRFFHLEPILDNQNRTETYWLSFRLTRIDGDRDKWAYSFIFQGLVCDHSPYSIDLAGSEVDDFDVGFRVT